MKKTIWPFFFLYHWTRQKSGNNLKGSIWFSENCCAIDKIIFLGPNRSIETNISKNSCFHDDERFWPFFPRIIECDKPLGTVYQGPQGILTFIVQMIWTFNWHLGGRYKQTFQKYLFSRWKKFLARFLCIISFGKPRGIFNKGQQAFQTFTVELIKAFFKDLRGCWKHKILKKMAIFPVKKRFWPTF